MDTGEDVRIERMVRHKKRRPGEEIEVLLSDASSFFAAMRIWQQKPFHEGDIFSRDEIQTIRRESEIIAITSTAMDLLSRMDHSLFLLRQKLRQRRMDPGLVDEVLAALQEQGLLDDSRFASSWVRSRIRRHPEGRSVLIAGLRQRGVNSSTAEAAVDSVFEDEDISMEDVAEQLARQFLRGRGASATSVTTKLVRRGFPVPLVRRILADIAGSNLPDNE